MSKERINHQEDPEVVEFVLSQDTLLLKGITPDSEVVEVIAGTKLQVLPTAKQIHEDVLVVMLSSGGRDFEFYLATPTQIHEQMMQILKVADSAISVTSSRSTPSVRQRIELLNQIEEFAQEVQAKSDSAHVVYRSILGSLTKLLQDDRLQPY